MEKGGNGPIFPSRPEKLKLAKKIQSVKLPCYIVLKAGHHYTGIIKAPSTLWVLDKYHRTPLTTPYTWQGAMDSKLLTLWHVSI